ncbi:hypothetical protein [Algibacillus agarilyticus]|uniref:hypothetical protein n=1 Tax=Algibacillus agarilyticus TaxID=2234133 RepID=UPI001E4359E5|nr:hypothetical protein [Algibacillus agarilyticus]
MIVPNQLLVEVLIVQFKVLLKSIDTLDKQIKKMYKVQDDKTLFDSLPGAGPQLAPRLLVAFIVIESSGKKHGHTGDAVTLPF